MAIASHHLSRFHHRNDDLERTQEVKRSNPDADATSPRAISWRGWKAIFKRVGMQMKEDHISIIGAGVAFNAFLAIFPLIIAAVSLYGLLVDPATLQQHIQSLTGVMPQAADDLVTERLRNLNQTGTETLSWGLALSILLSLWAANRGTKAMFEGVNIAYDSEESRGFFRKNAITLLFTLGGLLFGGVCLLLIAGVPAVADGASLPPFAAAALQIAVWPVLFFLLIIALGLVYKVAPVRANPKVKWISVGSAIAAIIWLAGSGAFSYFVANFGNYDKTYGSVAAVVILMLWLYLTSFVVLLGAEINSEVELQTAMDTTTGEPKPMGRRGAYHADHVA